MRVISLLPSATEMVCALGEGASLVGISHECDFPAEIRDRPVLTRSLIDPNGSSRAIDRAVRGVLAGALSIYEVDVDRLGALRPDVVITQDLCEVCAVSLVDVRSALARAAHRAAVELISLRPTRIIEVMSDLERIARVLGAGAAVRARLEHRIRGIAVRASTAVKRPRVVTLEWIDPLMVGGTWMPELVELAHGVALGATTGGPAPTIEAHELGAMAPDVVVIKACGFTVERTLAERDVIDRNVVAMVAKGTRVYVTDGNAFFNRPGPRLVESLEIMAACVQPELFPDLVATHAPAIVRVA
ncbi:MAG: BtuF-related (seleno)protein [Kofleriaceae bacterium]|nr:BtuF-related (seleno)protein [Kofleriaceae bacterium]